MNNEIDQAYIRSLYNCHQLTLNYPQKNSWWDVIFQPSLTSMPNGALGERLQRQVESLSFDQSIFKSILTVRSNSNIDINLPASTLLTDRQIETIQSSHFIESLFGRLLCIFVTAAIFRFHDLIFQSIKNYIATLNFKSVTKKVIQNLLIGIQLSILLYSGYEVNDCILFYGIVSLLLKVLSLNYYNNLSRIIKLSDTKDFILNNFILKKLLCSFLESYMFIYGIIKIIVENPQDRNAIIECCCPKDEKLGFFQYGYQRQPFYRTEYYAVSTLEYISTVLGKTIFDLLIALACTKIYNGDLRDPMAWVVAPLKSIFKEYNANYCKIIERKKELNSEYSKADLRLKPIKQRFQNTPINNAITDTNYNQNPINNKEPITQPKGKKKTHKIVDTTQNVAPTEKKPVKIKTRIEIIANNCIFTFYRLHGQSFESKNVWGIIISNSSKISNNQRYQQCLQNGHIGKNANIRQLIGHGGATFEIDSGMDPRLIGHIYNPGNIYNGLQNHLLIEDALNLVQEMEKQCGQNTSLIIFSSEAKKHHEISKKSRKIK